MAVYFDNRCFEKQGLVYFELMIYLHPQAVIDWLSYTPKTFNATAPPLPHSATLIDPPERLVDFLPSKTPYDPRHMLGGATQADGTFVSGFFDKGSFKEYLGGWGKSVVAGEW